MIRLFQILLTLSCAFILQIGNAQALDVDKIRFGVHADKTRLVIELNQATQFRSFILPEIKNKPYRLVIDLPSFDWRAGRVSPPPKTTVLGVRSGVLNSNVERIVVDLSKPAKIKDAFLIPPKNGQPNRLVVDYQTISQSAFNTTERTPIGTLPSTTGDLNLLIANAQKTAPPNDPRPPPASNIAQTVADMITPPRKPTPPKKSVMQSSSTILYRPLIVLDPGHGGQDPGAIGAENQREKYVTLSAAKALKKRLEQTGRYRVHLTRDSDKYIRLSKRVKIARTKEADLFISIHADSIGKENIRGASIYTLSNKASDSQTAKLAKRENQADLIAGVDLSHEDKDVANILLDLTMRDTMNQSKFFANTVVDHMRARGMRILSRPHRYAGFAVLKAPDIPSILLEIGFMSNVNEARLLTTKAYQQKIAATLTDSIDDYFKKMARNKQ